MAIQLNSSSNSSVKAVVNVNSLEYKIQQAVNNDCLVIRLNISAYDNFGKPTKSDPSKSSCMMLSTNKGGILFRRKDSQVFMQVKQHGIICWNPGKQAWSLPPASVKNEKGEELPASNTKPSGISAILIKLLRESLKSNDMTDLLPKISLSTVWNEEFNCDIPMSKDEVMQLRNTCLDERLPGRKLSRSMVMAVQLICDRIEDEFVFRMKVVDILSTEETVMDLPTGSGEVIDRSFYQAAFDEADAEELPDNSEAMGRAAVNYLERGSRKARKRADKKAEFRAKAQAEAKPSVAGGIELAPSSTPSTTIAESSIEEEVRVEAKAIKFSDLDIM